MQPSVVVGAGLVASARYSSPAKGGFMGMFRRRRGATAPAGVNQVAPHALPTLPAFQAVLSDDQHTFRGSERNVTVDGFELARPDGSPILLSSDGPVDERVFYFRVTGIGHHEAGAQAPSFAPLSQIYLVREPANLFDANALKVVGQDHAVAGYVPRDLAAIISPIVDRVGIAGASGIVTRTYATIRGRNAIEVLALVNRNIDLRATYEDDGHYKPNIATGFVVKEEGGE